MSPGVPGPPLPSSWKRQEGPFCVPCKDTVIGPGPPSSSVSKTSHIHKFWVDMSTVGL